MKNWLNEYWVWLLVADIILTIINIFLKTTIAKLKSKIDDHDRETIIHAIDSYIETVVGVDQYKKTKPEHIADYLKYLDQLKEKI